MLYFIAFLIFFVLMLLIINSSLKKKQKKNIEQIRNSWGKTKTGYFNFGHIEKYFNLNSGTCFQNLTRQTKQDIDFDDLFSFIDRTTSKPGQQYLYDALSKPTNNVAGLQQLNDQVNFFSANKTIREETQLSLLQLNKDDAYYITTLLSEEFDKKPKWFGLIVAEVIAASILLILSFYYPVFLIWLLIPFTINLGIHYWNKNNTFQFIKSFPQLNILINLSKELVAKELPFEKEQAGQSIRQLKAFQAKRRFLNLGDSSLAGDMQQLFSIIIELIKAFCLVEFFLYFNLANELRNKQKDILKLFRYVGAIDMAISIASLRAGNIKTCTPVFSSAEKRLSYQAVYHPLIDNCVPNNIYVENKSVLITGSNMSGKSTFLRTVAANTIFAQTIYTCFAQEFITPILKIFSSVRIDDSLLDGKSFYFEEVNVMGLLVKEAAMQHQNLFILDEVFKGTNTIERIASAKAILSYLNKRVNIVFVATHDIELAELLKQEYELYHFTETVDDKELVFDHLLKPGAARSRNAIKLLEISGYPADIVAEAKKLSNNIMFTNQIPQ